MLIFASVSDQVKSRISFVSLSANRPTRLTQCCTQFKSRGVKILCVPYLHYYAAFTFLKWYGNYWNKTFYPQRVWIGYNIELTVHGVHPHPPRWRPNRHITFYFIFLYILGESSFTLFASLTYAYHYLMTLMKLTLRILKGHNSFSYLWKFEPNTPNGFGEILF